MDEIAVRMIMVRKNALSSRFTIDVLRQFLGLGGGEPYVSPLEAMQRQDHILCALACAMAWAFPLLTPH